MIYDKVHALRSLKPNKDFAWNGTDYSGLTYYGGDTVPTEAEIDVEVTKLNDAEPMRLLREERDNKLAACDWTQAKDVTLSNETDWTTYRQALRDLPASASPALDSSGNLDMSSVTFPTEPS